MNDTSPVTKETTKLSRNHENPNVTRIFNRIWCKFLHFSDKKTVYLLAYLDVALAQKFT